jgi:hypothetical protein
MYHSYFCKLLVPGKKKKASRRYLGVLLAIHSALIGPLTSIIVKGLPEYHPMTVASWRFIGMLLPSLLMLSFHKFFKRDEIFNSFKGDDKWKLISFVVVSLLLLIYCRKIIKSDLKFTGERSAWKLWINFYVHLFKVP